MITIRMDEKWSAWKFGAYILCYIVSSRRDYLVLKLKVVFFFSLNSDAIYLLTFKLWFIKQSLISKEKKNPDLPAVSPTSDVAIKCLASGINKFHRIVKIPWELAQVTNFLYL